MTPASPLSDDDLARLRASCADDRKAMSWHLAEEPVKFWELRALIARLDAAERPVRLVGGGDPIPPPRDPGTAFMLSDGARYETLALFDAEYESLARNGAPRAALYEVIVLRTLAAVERLREANGGCS